MKGPVRFAGFLLVFGFGSLFWDAFGEHIARPRPYRNVELIHIKRNTEGLTFVANFEKLQCTIVKFEWVGSTSGVTTILPFADVDGEQLERPGRSKGAHTLRHHVKTDNFQYDWIEARTTHDCGKGDFHRQVFYHIEPVPVISNDNN